jgi:TatA/E family protein of Tat protein translocase
VLDIGMQELIIIFVVALIVFGPKKLPELARTLGRAMGELKKAMYNFKDTLEEADIRESMRDKIADFTFPQPPEKNGEGEIGKDMNQRTDKEPDKEPDKESDKEPDKEPNKEPDKESDKEEIFPNRKDDFNAPLTPPEKKEKNMKNT